MKLRVAMTAELGFLLGAWAYLAEWSYERPGSLHETLQDPLVVSVLMLLAILTGFLVARPWVPGLGLACLWRQFRDRRDLRST